MRQIIIKTDGTIEDTTIERKPELRGLQAIVGGLIESIPHMRRYDGQRVREAWCNEEGLFTKPFNERATKLWRENLGPGPFSYEPRLHGDIVLYVS